MNIIFCTSPFQVLVAREVVRRVEEEFCGVYLMMSNDLRQEQYAKGMHEFCREVYVIDGNNIMETIKEIISHGPIEKLFLASMDNPVALTLWNPINTELYTFDDGSTSIIFPNMYTDSLERKISPINLSMKTILESVKTHFTIFDDCVLFPKEKQIKIELKLEPDDFSRAKNGKTIKVFLGQALGNCFVEKDQKYTELLTRKAIKESESEWFYPHPRVCVPVENVKVVNTLLCFEEEIYQLLQTYEFVEVYGFYSTSLVLVQNIPGVHVQGFRTFLSTHETSCLERLGIPFETISISESFVSIILPVYNSASTLSKVIDSVLNQTHSNFELLIIDDGSIDETKDICQTYLEDSRVRYIHREHLGISNTLNYGIEMSTGEIIARQDGDDYWLPWHLELLLIELENSSTLDIVGSYVCVENQKLPYKYYMDPSVEISGEKLWMELAYRNIFNHSTVVYRKKKFEEVGGYRPECDGFEDWHLWARMVTKENAKVLKCITAFYNANPHEKVLTDKGLQFRVRLSRSRGLSLNDILS